MTSVKWSYLDGVLQIVFNKKCNAKGTLDVTANRKRRRRRRWCRQKEECSPAVMFAFSVFLLSAFSTVSASSYSKNWKTNHNGFSSSADYNVKNLHTSQQTDKQIEEPKGGTKWATANEEAHDELHDAEILRAVQQSINEWEERRRIRKAKRQATADDDEPQSRPKRSSADKSDSSDDTDEGKEPIKVCYEELGCFEEAGYIDLLPNSPVEVNTRYLMYNSRRSRSDTPLLDVSAQNVSSLWEWVGKAFNVSAPTKVIVHGFGSSCSNVWVYEMRSALMSVEDCNIICVDWENGATIPNYVRASANTRLVGKQLAILLSGLEKYVNVSLRNVHLIGFSLGAHVAGFAGSELKNLSRITGLDPAGPLFESQDRRVRLDSMDAQFVDIIHSNGENLILGGLGAWQPMGHVDFYPNGGRMQKGCTNLFVGAVSDMLWSANEVYGRSLCNHRRAYKFFTDSVSAKCQFPAVPCESYDHFVEGRCFPCQNTNDCSNMGYYSDKFPGRGALFLLTRDEEPFCANQYMVKVENSPFKDSTDKKLITFGKLQILLIGDQELNETFTITQKRDEKLTRGESISRIIVPHPALQNFLKIQITYLPYKGWLSSGEPRWRIDKISLTNSYGQILSACKEDLELESGIPIMLQLTAKDCSQANENNFVKTNRTTKPSGHDADEYHTNHTFSSPHPAHTQVVRLGNEILNMNEAALSSALNGGEWVNSSSVQLKPYKPMSNVYNASKLGVGVTEYLNDPWKQKADFYDSATPSVLNNLDNVNYDNGEGRRLNLDAPSHKRSSSSNNKVPNVTETSTPEIQSATTAASRHSPESVTKHQKTPHPGLNSNAKLLEAPNKVEKEITEPVLKPKVSSSTTHSTMRSRKSQNTYRPNNGKSINMAYEQSTSASVATGRRSGGAVAYVNASLTRTTTELPEQGNEFLDLVEYNGKPTARKSEPEAPKNSSSQSFVVQFLPQKLVSFLEQAERYARMAFLPFISPQDGSKSAVTRRVRTFNSNRRTNLQSESSDKPQHDMETELSVNMAEAAVAPAPPSKVVSSFPYAYHMPRQYLWQPMYRYPMVERKYIPLTKAAPAVPRLVFPEEDRMSKSYL